MRVLFLIPKNDPPQLEGNFSKAFKDFVQLCTQKEADKVFPSFFLSFFSHYLSSSFPFKKKKKKKKKISVHLQVNY